jgi:hypothetical protein
MTVILDDDELDPDVVVMGQAYISPEGTWHGDLSITGPVLTYKMPNGSVMLIPDPQGMGGTYLRTIMK